MNRTLSLACLTLACFSLSATPAPQDAPERPWTLMIYGAADNNADGPILHFLDNVRTALDDDPGMEIVLWIDRSKGFSDDSEFLGADFHGARIYRLRKDSAELLDADDYFPGMSESDLELDSADPENVGKFIAFCKERFPAQRYGMMIYSHADGCSMCPDEQSHREMNIPELTDWVGSDASVDFLALELCNMAGIEIAYQWRPGNGGFSADVLVAIPNAGPPLDWDRAFARIRSEGHAAQGDVAVLDPATMSAADFGKLVIEEGHLGRKAMAARHPDHAEELGHEAAGCYDLRKSRDVKRAVDRLAVALAASDSKEVFEGLRGSGGADSVMNYTGGDFGPRPYADLFELCERAAGCQELTEATRTAAGEVCKAVDAFVLASFGMDGYEDFEPGKNGVFIVFPDGDAKTQSLLGPVSVWSVLDWYTPLDAEGETQPYGRWAFLGDGATPENGEVENWFELLDSWFDDTSSDPRGSNRYAW